MPSAKQLVKKEAYDAKLCELLDTHTKAFLVHADNVGSMQMMNIRAGLRENSTVLMGKNTLIRRCLRLYVERTGNEQWLVLLDHLVGNVGLIFTQGDLNEVRDKIQEFKVGAPARVGLVAPNDVTVYAGNTGMDPSQTSFFQALNISTKINKGTVEIVSDVHLIKPGEKVGASQATLLAKLGIKPFTYGLVVKQVYDNGSLYDPKVLDITDETLGDLLTAGIRNVAAASLALDFPTMASAPHSLINGYKNALAIAVETDYTFPLAEKVKAYLADPTAFASAAAPAGGGDAPAAAAAAAAPAEEEEEEEEDMGFSLFD
ncbi:RPLP0 [Auxenochlorella protothecoides x Auxenochlorella symbiontica]